MLLRLGIPLIVGLIFLIPRPSSSTSNVLKEWLSDVHHGKPEITFEDHRAKEKEIIIDIVSTFLACNLPNISQDIKTQMSQIIKMKELPVVHISAAKWKAIVDHPDWNQPLYFFEDQESVLAFVLWKKYDLKFFWTLHKGLVKGMCPWTE
jgi:hypothetical protein